MAWVKMIVCIIQTLSQPYQNQVHPTAEKSGPLKIRETANDELKQSLTNVPHVKVILRERNRNDATGLLAASWQKLSPAAHASKRLILTQPNSANVFFLFEQLSLNTQETPIQLCKEND